MNPQDQKLEQIIHQTLRGLPERRAPDSLESRVLAAVAARGNRAWWRQSFVHWPLAARSAFALAAVAVVAALAVLGTRGSLPLPHVDGALALLADLRFAAAALTEAGAAVVRGIPTLWWYSALLFLGVLYAALFGIGVTAYRTLVANR
jgi:hypothetical protein